MEETFPEATEEDPNISIEKFVARPSKTHFVYFKLFKVFNGLRHRVYATA